MENTGMHFIDWAIMFAPFAAVLGLAVYAKRYARDAVDFLAAGRVAGRYVISVGDVAASLSVITIVANCEATYRAGSAMSFWGILPTLLGMFLSLSGYCVWRWRATRALSFGQFLEMRYNRTFRVFCAVLRNLTEMVANAIGPAIAANFFVYFLGLPHHVAVFGRAVPTFALVVGACLACAMLAVWPAGRISLLVTDTVQGMLSYPIFAIVAAWIFFKFDWHETMEPVMMNRVPGESFLNPFDIDKLRDFNLFALGVWLMSTILQRASWFGNDTSGAGRTPHEQKMAGVLGTWRNGYAYTMIGLVTLLVITVMNHAAFVLPGAHGGFSSHGMRVALLNKVAEEAFPDGAVRGRIAAALDALPPRLQDEPLSQLRNNDTPYIDAV
ncbi:MAG: sodium:panthothenate symporter, partial [Kiritimatiellae bacterium]|nr:sodium:panthothenate symporter [Kiritimatiellia bacterium]